MKRLYKDAFVAFILATGLLLAPLFSTSANAATIDLMPYYPNAQMISTHYLEGYNYSFSPARRSVLWFEKAGNQTSRVDNFRLYNSGPEDPQRRCNYDQLSWNFTSTNKATGNAALRYTQTRNTCNISATKPVTDITYSPGIAFLPRYWNDAKPWVSTGSSKATYKEGATTGSLVTKCTGTNTYKAEILGREVIDIPTGLSAIHWRTTQTTAWTSGPGSTYSGCRPGTVTNWQEDYYLIDTLPTVNGTPKKGLKRSVGGNKDVSFPNWDVWLDKWQPLPTGL
jgi:hypothetical protein